MVLILNEQSAWLLKTGLSVPDSLCIAAPPLRKNRRRGVCGEGATVHKLVSDGWSISNSSVKTANNQILVSSVFNDSEGLYGTTVCRYLVRRPHYSCLSGHVVRASSPPKCLDRDCVGRRRTETRHGNVYRIVGEKQGNVVFIGNAFYKQWHLCVLFH